MSTVRIAGRLKSILGCTLALLVVARVASAELQAVDTAQLSTTETSLQFEGSAPAAGPMAAVEWKAIRSPEPALLGGSTKISGPLVANGDVSLYSISADGASTVYAADQDVDGVTELFRVPTGGGTVTQLNPALVSLGNVLSFVISADGSRVIYRADQDADEVIELFSVPIGGGSAVQLNPALVAGGDVANFVVISFDSTRVVYIADQEVNDVFEVYSVPIAGGASTKLNGSLPPGGSLVSFAITEDSSRIAYLADQEFNDVFELYSVPIAGGARVKLNPTLVFGGDVSNAYQHRGARTFYFADQDTDNVIEIYSVSTAGGAVTKLNGTLVAGGNTAMFSHSLQKLSYLADQQVNEAFEMFVVPHTGGVPLKLNAPLIFGGDVTTVSLPDDTTGLYRADQDVDEVFELFASPTAGGGPIQLNPPLVPGGDVSGFLGISVGDLPKLVLYLADQNADEVLEIYSVPFTGGPSTKLNGPMVAGGDVASVIVGTNGVVVYRADQDVNDVVDLYETTTAGVGGVNKLNGPLVFGGDVLDFAQPATGSHVVYRADQDVDEVLELYSVLLDADADHDGFGDGLDCLAYDATVWAAPGEATTLMLSHAGGLGGTTSLTWTAPTDAGGTSPVYDTIRSTLAADFVTSSTCVESNGADTASTDMVTPASEEVFFFLVRAQNICGTGSLGMQTGGIERSGRPCP